MVCGGSGNGVTLVVLSGSSVVCDRFGCVGRGGGSRSGLSIPTGCALVRGGDTRRVSLHCLCSRNQLSLSRERDFTNRNRGGTGVAQGQGLRWSRVCGGIIRRGLSRVRGVCTDRHHLGGLGVRKLVVYRVIGEAY